MHTPNPRHLSQHELEGLDNSPGHTDAAAELREYLAILRVRKWSVIITAILALALVLSYSYWQTPIYSAEARVLVNPPASGAEALFAVSIVDTETESQIVRSEPVADRVREELDLDLSTDSLIGRLKVNSVPDSRVLELSFSSTDPEAARDITNAFAASYIDYRRDQALEVVRGQQESVQTQIRQTSAELERISGEQDKAEKNGNESLAASLEESKNVLLARLGVLQQELTSYEPDQATLGGGDIIQSARLPGSPSSPNHLTNGILALLLGLPLGIGIAFLRERLDDRFRGGSDVERVLDTPLLATVPRFKSKPSEPQPADVVVLTEPRSMASEAYRSLRTNLQFLLSQRDIKSLVVTSPSVGEGKTCTTVNLGLALAQAGLRIILVSSDLRRPSLEKYFGHSHKTKGLSDWLISKDQNLWEYLINPGVPNIRLMCAGSIPPNPAELLTSERFRDTLKALEENADLVLVDSPPVFAVADPAILAALTGSSLLVLDAASTHKSAAVRAKREVERAGGQVIGTVLNSFDPSTSPYYYYESPYYYAYYAYNKYHEDKDAAANGSKTRARKFGRTSRAKSKAAAPTPSKPIETPSVKPQVEPVVSPPDPQPQPSIHVPASSNPTFDPELRSNSDQE